MKELISGHISISLPTEIKDDDWRALKRQMNETSEQGFLVDQLRLVLPNKRCDAALEDDDPEEVETRNMVTLLNVRPVSVILRLRSPDQLLKHLNVDRLSELIIHDSEKFAEAQACALLGKCVHLQKLTLSSSRADLVLHESFVPTVSTLKQLTELTLDVSIPAESYQQLPTTLQELTLSNLSSKVSITHITGLNRLILKAPSCEPSTLLDIANMPDLEQLEIIYTSNNALAAEAHAALWPALSVLGSLTFDWLDNVALSPSVAAGIAAATQISHLVIKIKDIPASLDLGDVLMPLQNLQHLALKLDFYNAPLSSFAELLNKATKLTTLELSWPSLPLLQLKQVCQKIRPGLPLQIL